MQQNVTEECACIRDYYKVSYVCSESSTTGIRATVGVAMHADNDIYDRRVKINVAKGSK